LFTWFRNSEYFANRKWKNMIFKNLLLQNRKWHSWTKNILEINKNSILKFIRGKFLWPIFFRLCFQECERMKNRNFRPILYSKYPLLRIFITLNIHYSEYPIVWIVSYMFKTGLKKKSVFVRNWINTWNCSVPYISVIRPGP
jgi:hypothetical protein